MASESTGPAADIVYVIACAVGGLGSLILGIFLRAHFQDAKRALRDLPHFRDDPDAFERLRSSQSAPTFRGPTSTPSPATLKTRPWCLATSGISTYLRRALRAARVPGSSTAMSRLKPTTSAAIDVLQGGNGDDLLDAGIGPDLLIFDMNEFGADTVLGYDSSEDTITFSSVGDQDGDSFVAFADLLMLVDGVSDDGTDVTVQFTSGSTIAFVGAGTGGISDLDQLIQGNVNIS